MDAVEKGFQSQLNNIQAKTGQSLEQMYALARASGRTRHGEIRDLFMRELGLGHGDANTLTKFYLKQAGAAGAAAHDPLDELYAGSKAELRPVHDRLMAAIEKFGPFEIAPKKAYLSLRRKKQFATLGPASKGRVEVGLNARGLPHHARLAEQPAGSICQYKVFISGAKDVDKELIGWIRQAYDSAG